MQTKIKIQIMSSPPIFLMVILIFALLVLFVEGSRPLGSKLEDYTMFRPKVIEGKHRLGGKQVEGCMPKGRRHSSAPSRYINYQPLDSLMCSPLNHRVDKPWISCCFDAHFVSLQCKICYTFIISWLLCTLFFLFLFHFGFWIYRSLSRKKKVYKHKYVDLMV